MALVTKSLANENNRLRDEIKELKQQIDKVREQNNEFLETLDGCLRANELSMGTADELAQTLGHYLEQEIEGEIVVRYKVKATVPPGFTDVDVSDLMFFPDPELEDEELDIRVEQYETTYRLTNESQGCII